MSWKKWTTIAVISALIITNFYLIFKKDSKIARAEYINEWRTAKEQNLVQSKGKPGVIAPVEEEYVYYQNGLGDFEQFLVKKGDEIQSGTPLFEYSSKSIEGVIEQYEAEISKLETEQDALEDNIDDLEKLEKSLSAKKDEEGKLTHEAAASSVEAQIYEKELQLSRVEAEIEKLEDLVSISDTSLGEMMVESTISGTVKDISHDLQNPVVTIASSEQHVVGMLEEKEVQEIQEGMKAIIYGSFGKKEGIISKVDVLPEQDVHVSAESQYQFTVDFQEESEDEADTQSDLQEDQTEEETDTQSNEVAEEPTLITGTHVELKIITHEVEDALTLPETAIHRGNIYVLKGDGTIEKRPVETGLEVNGIHEITSDLEAGEYVIKEPRTIKNKTDFFTPVEISKMKKKDFKDMRKKEIFRYIGRGFLSR